MRTKTEKRRETILAAAAAVFEERGIEAASMAEIAARVGGSKATLYNYFPSKEALLLAVACSRNGRDYMAPFEALRAPATPTREGLAAFALDYLEAVCTPQTLSMLRMSQQAGHSALGRALYEHGPGPGWEQAADYLARMIEAGQLRPASPALAARQLRALLGAEWLHDCLLGVRELPDAAERAEITHRAVDTFLRAYAPETLTPPARAADAVASPR